MNISYVYEYKEKYPYDRISSKRGGNQISLKRGGDQISSKRGGKVCNKHLHDKQAMSLSC